MLYTLVLLGAFLGRRDAAAALALRAVATGYARLAISDEGLRELLRVTGYDRLREKAPDPARVMEVGLDVGYEGTMYYPERRDWPTVTDPKDHWVLDLAYEAGADYVVTKDRHFTDKAHELELMGFDIVEPGAFVAGLALPPAFY